MTYQLRLPLHTNPKPINDVKAPHMIMKLDVWDRSPLVYALVDLTVAFDASLIVSRLDESESDSVTNIIRNSKINRLCYFKKESKQEHS